MFTLLILSLWEIFFSHFSFSLLPTSGSTGGKALSFFLFFDFYNVLVILLNFWQNTKEENLIQMRYEYLSISLIKY